MKAHSLVLCTKLRLHDLGASDGRMKPHEALTLVVSVLTKM